MASALCKMFFIQRCFLYKDKYIKVYWLSQCKSICSFYSRSGLITWAKMVLVMADTDLNLFSQTSVKLYSFMNKASNNIVIL